MIFEGVNVHIHSGSEATNDGDSDDGSPLTDRGSLINSPISFADIPLLWFYNEVMVNPKAVADWQYPGLGAGRSTHFHLLKAVK